ncbi:MFS transporter [Nocardiopsis xinjiangensis]|uniref:MFS transporter n=1 Tax=Nocardiopsis xinjiangensis TaxID=124285 RepID=UPI00034B4FC4|nr:MFS transporter [Nocardiopsis xinjiangensis]
MKEHFTKNHPGPPEDSAREAAGPSEWAALAALVLPVLLISVDMTILSFAVPHLSKDLAPGPTQLLWIVDVYSFVLAASLVTMGTLGDRVGRRRLLVWGSAGFGLASLLVAYAQSPEMLILGRALLGVAGAALMPSTLALIRTVFAQERQRAIAVAVWASVLSVGSALGPIFGGLLLEHFWWGSLFLANVPVVVLLVVAVPLLVPESRADEPGSLDPASVLFLVMMMIPIVYGIKQTVVHGPGLLAALSALVGAVSLVLFVRRQAALTTPMLDLGLFSIASFRIAVLLNMFTLFAMVSVLFYLSQHLQAVLGMAPVQAGLALLPGLTLSVVGSFCALAVVARLGSPRVLLLGLGHMVVGFAMLSLMPDPGRVAYLIGAFCLVCFGAGLVQSLTNNIVITSTPPDRAGSASSVSETGYELGAALGIALMGSVLAAVYQTGLAGEPSVTAEARGSIAGAMEAASQLPPEEARLLEEAASAAFTHAVHVTSAVIAAVLILITAVTALSLRGERRSADSPSVPTDPDARSDPETMPDRNEPHDSLDELRHELDSVDRILLNSLLLRRDCIRRIGLVKHATNTSVMQPERVRSVLGRATEFALDSGMNPYVLQDVYASLIKEACREEDGTGLPEGDPKDRIEVLAEEIENRAHTTD